MPHHRHKRPLLDLEMDVLEDALRSFARRIRKVLGDVRDFEKSSHSVPYSVYAMALARRLNPRSRINPTDPITRMANMTRVSDRLFHSFHTKYPMPVPPTSISAATTAIQALPIEMRSPATIVGAAAGRMTLKRSE